MTDTSTRPTPVIVVGVDGSDRSKDALRWAARQAELTGAALHAIIAWHFPNLGAGLAPVPAVNFGEDARQALANTVKEVLGDQPAVATTQTVTEGAPAFTLLQAADGADLLVVGSRGHGAFAGMLLGSVSEHCVAHAGCPVVVVRHRADPR